MEAKSMAINSTKIDASGNVTIGDTLNIVGDTVVGGGATITGPTTVAQLTASTATISGNASVAGNADVEGTVTIGDTIVGGSASIGSLSVTGNTSMSGQLIVDDNTEINGDLTVNGQIIGLTNTGPTITDIIRLNTDVSGDVVPSKDAGISVSRGNEESAHFIWNESEDKWTAVTGDLDSGNPSLADVEFGNTNTSNLSVSGSTTMAGELRVAEYDVGQLSFVSGLGVVSAYVLPVTASPVSDTEADPVISTAENAEEFILLYHYNGTEYAPLDLSHYPDGFYKITCKSPWSPIGTNLLEDSTGVVIDNCENWLINNSISTTTEFTDVEYESGIFTVEKHDWYTNTNNPSLVYQLKVIQHIPSTRYTGARFNRYRSIAGYNGYSATGPVRVRKVENNIEYNGILNPTTNQVYWTNSETNQVTTEYISQEEIIQYTRSAQKRSTSENIRNRVYSLPPLRYPIQ